MLSEVKSYMKGMFVLSIVFLKIKKKKKKKKSVFFIMQKVSVCRDFKHAFRIYILSG